MEAADVLPYSETLVKTLSPAISSLAPTASIIRILAWCGTKRSTSSIPRLLRFNIALQTLTMLRTACLYVSRPCMERKKFSSTGCSATYWQAVPPPTVIRSRNFPSLWQITSRTEPMDWEASDERTQAAAASPKSTQVLLSFQFSLLVIASEQTNRMWLCGSNARMALQSQRP